MTSERAVEPLTPDELALLRESTDPQYRRLPMPERALVARLLAAATPEPRDNGWEEPELRRWTDRVASEKAWTRQELAELVEFAQRLLPRLAAARGEPGLDVERLMEAMNEAFTYEDRDNSQPTLSFVDDVEAFWTPFAAQVAAEYAALATPTTPEPDQ